MRHLIALAALAAVTLSAGCADRDGASAPDGTGTPGHSAPTSSSTPAAPTPTTTVPGPDGAPVEIPSVVAERHAELGGPDGSLGAPLGPSTDVAGGSVTDFAGGAIVLTPDGRAFVVQGEILTAYREAGGPGGDLGFPISDETTTDGGWVSAFENGSIAYVDGRPVVETR